MLDYVFEGETGGYRELAIIAVELEDNHKIGARKEEEYLYL